MDASIIAIIIQLIFLECILSIDNAAVMGAMVAHLPRDELPPWPRRLRRLFGWSNRILGNQRAAALKVGLIGAYAGRVLMLALASAIIRQEWVQILGAVYLFYLAIDHFADLYREDEQAASGGGQRFLRSRSDFWYVVLALNLADMAFSLDNVVAAVALSDQLWVVMLGVGIGIVVIRFAATIFTRLIEWEPALEHAAYLLLFAIGGEFLLEKVAGIHIGELVQFSISVCILALAVIFARVRMLKPLLVIFTPWMVLFAAIQGALALIFSALKLQQREER